eukprot:6179273-Pleurochrysis_carterae.AAC.2
MVGKNTYRRLQKGAVLEAITNVRKNLGTVIFMWIPSHVGIAPNMIVDNIAAREQEEAPEGIITGSISKQIRSRPIIYCSKVQGQIELADSPIYQEARRSGKKVIRDMHKPSEGGGKCESGVARVMVGACKAKEGVGNGHGKAGEQEKSRKNRTWYWEWKNSRRTSE